MSKTSLISKVIFYLFWFRICSLKSLWFGIFKHSFDSECVKMLLIWNFTKCFWVKKNNNNKFCFAVSTNLLFGKRQKCFWFRMCKNYFVSEFVKMYLVYVKIILGCWRKKKCFKVQTWYWFGMNKNYFDSECTKNDFDSE